MSKRRSFSPTAIAVVSALIAACSSDTPTAPPTASIGLTTTAPAIGLSTTYFLLCYPSALGSNRPCGSTGSLSIRNTGGGTLNWTATKSATWLKRSPRTGTAPSTMKVWVDTTGLRVGWTYYGSIRIWATGATNSPQTVSVSFRRWH